MNLQVLILFALKTSIVLIVFGLSLRASLQEATYLFHRPGQLVRSLLSMYVIMPIFAVAVALFFNLQPAVEIALVALALSPVPPILPKKTLKAGGKASYMIGLLVSAALLAIVFVPLVLELLERIFAVPLGISPGAIALLVLITVLIPLAAGIAVRGMAPAFAEKIANPVSLLATVMLLACVLPILFTAWPAMVSLIGNGHILAFAAFNILGLAVGHLLGGPGVDSRTVLALSTASRHPGVAIAIAQANFPEQKLVLAAVLLYLIVNATVSILYLAWSKRRRAGHISNG